MSQPKPSKAKPAKLVARLHAIDAKVESDGTADRLTTDELIEYFQISWELYPETMRQINEEALIDRGMTNRELFEMLEKAMAKTLQKN